MPKHLPTQRGHAAPAASAPSLKPSLPSHAPPAVKAATQGGGQALDGRTAAEMSARFGHDFSSIRVHADSRAGDAAAALGATAYALGSDVVFGAGKYQPGSSDTDRLLAHELTHVVQQSRFGIGDWGRTSNGSDASEREADSVASQVMMGQSVSVQAAPQAAVARFPPPGLGGGRNDNNAPDDWGEAICGVGFDHFGPPGSGFCKPSLADGAPSDFAPSNGRPPLSPGGTLAPQDDDTKSGPTVQAPLPGPRVPQPDPPGDFMPPAPPAPPITILPPFQYTPHTFPGIGQSDPIAPQVPPLGAQPPGTLPPLSPPTLFPPAPAPLPPMVPPLALDPGALTPPNVDEN